MEHRLRLWQLPLPANHDLSQRFDGQVGPYRLLRVEKQESEPEVFRRSIASHWGSDRGQDNLVNGTAVQDPPSFFRLHAASSQIMAQGAQ